MKRSALLGTAVSIATMDETVEWAAEVIRLRAPTQHVVVNAAKLVMMERDPGLREIVNGCPVVNADGQSVVWAGWLFGIRIPERVTGIDLMGRLLERGSAEGWRIYLLGAQHDVVAKLVVRLSKHVTIAGWRDGYWAKDEDDDVVGAIAGSGADVLFVALPSPWKEEWIAPRLQRLGVPLCVGVGGSFDVLAGVRRRAPAWMQRSGLEWLFRLAQEPRRLTWRYAKTNVLFAAMVGKELLSRPRSGGMRDSSNR